MGAEAPLAGEEEEEEAQRPRGADAEEQGSKQGV